MFNFGVKKGISVAKINKTNIPALTSVFKRNFYGYNKAILWGTVGKDAVVKTSQNGNKYLTFPLATNEMVKQSNGESKSEVQWHNIQVVNQGLIDRVGERLQKGYFLHYSFRIFFLFHWYFFRRRRNKRRIFLKQKRKIVLFLQFESF